MCGSLSSLWHCLSLGLELKLTFSSPVATAEFSKFAGKEIEENNRMGKTRDFFEKIKDTKGIFHAKMGTTKDRS